MTDNLNPRITLLLRAAAFAGLVVVLLLLTRHAEAAVAEATTPQSTTVWRSAPRPLRVLTAAGKLPRYVGWFNLENAEITAGREGDVLQATLGSFPAGADAVLFHVMTWEPKASSESESESGSGSGSGSGIANGKTSAPARQHWSLVDRELRALPMTALKNLRHIQLVYVAYRRPLHAPVVYMVLEEGAPARPANKITDTSGADAASGLSWGTHQFTLAGAASRVSFALGEPETPATPDSGIFHTAKAYAELPLRAAIQSLGLFGLHDNGKPTAQISHMVPAWLANAAHLGYQSQDRCGLLLAGNGLSFQPVYTGWMAASFATHNAHVYGGMIAQTMMVLQPGHAGASTGSVQGLSNMNWGTGLGFGAGIEYSWQNNPPVEDAAD